MKHLVFPLFVGQGRKMDQPGSNGHGIHFPYQMAEPFLIPEDIRKIRKLTANIVVRDAQIVPIFMPSGEDVEVSPRPSISASYHPGSLLSKMSFPVQVSLQESCLRIQLYSIAVPYPRLWLLTEARMTSVSITFFSICAPSVRALVIRLSTRRGLPWEWLWTAERAACSMMEEEPPALGICAGVQAVPVRSKCRRCAELFAADAGFWGQPDLCGRWY